MQPQDVSAEYWRDNLLSPVLFSFAVEQAIVKHTPLDACIEAGPHPALKNPTIQTIENCAGAGLPYFGSMERNRDDVEAFTSSLGSLWTNFGSAAVDIEGLYGKIAEHADLRDVSKQLPSYSWDHSRSYRKESRALKSWLGADVPHLLLGKRSISSSPTSVQWQNFIRPRDISWLDGHSLQGQTVFPGAGYVVMALEAALETVVDRSNVKLLEVLDLSIDKAVTFEDENSIVELNISLETISRSATGGDLFSFAINSSLARETGLTTTASGKVALTYGSRTTDTLPSHSEEPPHSNNVSVDRFYSMLSEIGYGYAKEFRGISDMRRGDNKATGTMDFHSLSDRGRDLVIHPASLDVDFQCFIGAYTAPGDRRLRSLLVPTGIDRIALNPMLTFRKPDTNEGANDSAKFVSTSAASVGKTVERDIEVFDPETGVTMINIEGLSFKAFSPASADDNHQMFSKLVWNPLAPEKLLDDEQYHATEQDKKDVAIIERITYYYIRHFLSELTDEDRATQVFCFRKYIEWCDHMFAEAQAGRNVWYEQQWDKDDSSTIYGLIEE
jgi:acyl transferase domain-containing protein